MRDNVGLGSEALSYDSTLPLHCPCELGDSQNWVTRSFETSDSFRYKVILRVLQLSRLVTLEGQSSRCDLRESVQHDPSDSGLKDLEETTSRHTPILAIGSEVCCDKHLQRMTNLSSDKQENQGQCSEECLKHEKPGIYLHELKHFRLGLRT
ncbi:hypothetical protein MG293_012527 [Ovis ammon polii]|uniref:Uncharacterized protein n=1 Tax=Ovis ammon polii TaxID=230172 RepID=A0AAD4U4G2_OVIAM|nr:hypothetical protein MG293_012527 [Ovis ammon polii]